jgi:hypothetical protein
MHFARRVFMIAGLYGLVALLPQYFMEGKVGTDYPPAITHPEYFYGFLGVALAWQIAFLLIARDSIRYRAIMIPGVVEKTGFGVAVIVLFIQGRLSGLMLAAGLLDIVFAVCFIVAYFRTPTAKPSPIN